MGRVAGGGCIVCYAGAAATRVVNRRSIRCRIRSSISRRPSLSLSSRGFSVCARRSRHALSARAFVYFATGRPVYGSQPAFPGLLLLIGQIDWVGACEGWERMNGWSSEREAGCLNDSPAGDCEPLSSRFEPYEMIGEFCNGRIGCKAGAVGWKGLAEHSRPGGTRKDRACI